MTEDGAPVRKVQFRERQLESMVQNEQRYSLVKYVTASRKAHLMARIIENEGDGGEAFLHELRNIITYLDKSDEALKALFGDNLTRVARHKDSLAYAVVVSELQRASPDKERLRGQMLGLKDALEWLERGRRYDPPKVGVQQRLHRRIKFHSRDSGRIVRTNAGLEFPQLG
jgi:hypothetical protein